MIDTIVLRHWGRVVITELRCQRRIRGARLRLATGMPLREVLRGLTIYDGDMVRVGEHYFLISPEDPHDTEGWTWWVCGPVADPSGRVISPMAHETWIPGHGPHRVLAFCSGWDRCDRYRGTAVALN
ncbi:hypothetical protein ACWEVD_01205 [Nocardia thailandica]